MIFDLSEFQDKKIIITGSSTGIGFETAIEFLELGANVIFHGNTFFSLLNIAICRYCQFLFAIDRSEHFWLVPWLTGF